MNKISLQLPHEIAGMQDKPYLANNAILQTIGMDLYTNPGVIQTGKSSNNISTTLSGALIGAPSCIVAVTSDLMYIFFNKTIYKYNPTSTALSALGTAATQNVVNAVFFGGKVYFIGSTAIGTINVSTDAVTNGVHTLLNGNLLYHPVKVLYDNLYIGDGSYVAVIDSGLTFTANGYDLDRSDLIITALDSLGTELIIASYSTQVGVGSEILRWNTWSEEPSSIVSIENISVISCFLQLDVGLFFIARDLDNYVSIYQYGEPRSIRYIDVPRITYGTGTSKVYPNAFTYFNGRAYFAVSNDTSFDGVYPGVYSFGSVIPGSKPVLALEHGLSSVLVGLSSANKWTIQAMSSTNLSLYYSWQNNNAGVSYNYGVDNTGGSAYNVGCQIKTGVLSFDRQNKKSFDVYVYYAKKGADATATINTRNINLLDSYTSSLVDDSVRRAMATTSSSLENVDPILTIDIPVGSTQKYIDISGIDLFFN